MSDRIYSNLQVRKSHFCGKKFHKGFPLYNDENILSLN